MVRCVHSASLSKLSHLPLHLGLLSGQRELDEQVSVCAFGAHSPVEQVRAFSHQHNWIQKLAALVAAKRSIGRRNRVEKKIH